MGSGEAIDAVEKFIETLQKIDFQQMFSWLPSSFAGAVISVIGVLIALRLLDCI